MSRIVPGFNKPPGQAGTQSDNTGQEAQPTPRTKQANAQANWPQTPRGQRTGNVKLGETGRGKQIADEDVDIPPKMVKWSDITQEDIDAEMKMILETENFDDGTSSSSPHAEEAGESEGDIHPEIHIVEQETIEHVILSPRPNPQNSFDPEAEAAPRPELPEVPALPEKDKTKTDVISTLAKKVTKHTKHTRSGSADVLASNEVKDRGSIISKVKKASEHVRTGSLGFSPLAKGKAKAKAKVPPLQMPAPPRPSTPAPKLAQTPREKLDVDGWKAATPRRDAGETKQDPTPLPTPGSNWTPATPREKPRDEKS
jgi:hypothetical protein